MKKVKLLIIKYSADRYGSGLTDYELKTLKNAHQCDLFLGVPVSQPLKGVEYPYFEIKEFEAKEQSFVDSYENEIEDLREEIRQLEREVRGLKWDDMEMVDGSYKTLFCIALCLLLIFSVILYTKL